MAIAVGYNTVADCYLVAKCKLGSFTGLSVVLYTCFNCNSRIRRIANFVVGHFTINGKDFLFPFYNRYRSANLCRCGLLIYAHYGEVRRGKHIPAILGRRAVDILNSAIVFHDERDNLAAIPSLGYLYANLGFAGISIVRGRRGHVIGHYSAFNSLNACYFSRMLGRSQRRKVGAGYANGVVIGGSIAATIAYGFVVGGNIYCSISLKPALYKHIRSGIGVAILHARANNAQYHANLFCNLSLVLM